MRIHIDRERCCHAGECYYNHPELFRMADDGSPVVLQEQLADGESRRHAEEAMEVCPAAAISLVDD